MPTTGLGSGLCPNAAAAAAAAAAVEADFLLWSAVRRILERAGPRSKSDLGAVDRPSSLLTCCERQVEFMRIRPDAGVHEEINECKTQIK